jgi:VanZ family protein
VMDFPLRLTAHLVSAARVSAWICVAAIAYLSLVPHSMEIRTPLPGGVEHAIAYAGTAALLKLGYPQQALWLIASALFAYSGVLEVLQTFVHGRHSVVAGALWSGGGALVGAFAAEAVLSLRRSSQTSNRQQLTP